MVGLVAAGTDYAKNPGLSLENLTALLRDIDSQPSWRQRADVDSDYYDSNQYDAETLREMERKGIPPIVVNLIAPTINLVLGMEAKVRQDWIVRADDESLVDFSEAMSKELQQAERETHADRACSDAYAGQLKAGLHWVHVRRQRLDPFGYPYVVEPVHRREIWWDWLDTTPNLSRARWLVRSKWYDFDVLAHMFESHKALIEQLAMGWEMFDTRAFTDQGQALYQDFLTEREFVFDADTWRNLDRRMARVYEVWYRVPRKAYIISFQNGLKSEFNRNDPLHVVGLEQGLAQVDYATIMDMRLSWWIGPHRLIDISSPLPHNDFPYVPFWGYREDRTGVPYGHIRAMRPLQDEVNARRARMLWQLSARRMKGDDDVVRDKRAAEEEAARPDAAIWLNPNRKNRRGPQDLLIEDNSGMNAQQMEAYRDAAQRLQDVAAVWAEQLGKAGAADSGIAISQLIEQGTTALAEINENYTFARKCVGEQLFSLVKADLGTREKEIKLQKKGSGRKVKVVLNQRKQDETTGLTYRSNDVMLTRCKVVLDAVPASASFRQYQLKEITDLVKKLPIELQGPMLDMVIEASDVPFKDEIVRRVREALGIRNDDPETMSAEEQAQLQAQLQHEETVKALEDQIRQLTAERADLENRQIDAETELTEATTLKTKVETDRLQREPITPPAAKGANNARATHAANGSG